MFGLFKTKPKMMVTAPFNRFTLSILASHLKATSVGRDDAIHHEDMILSKPHALVSLEIEVGPTSATFRYTSLPHEGGTPYESGFRITRTGDDNEALASSLWHLFKGRYPNNSVRKYLKGEAVPTNDLDAIESLKLALTRGSYNISMSDGTLSIDQSPKFEIEVGDA